MKWQPIETAPKVVGTEIIGSRWVTRDGVMVSTRDPYISFWSPSLRKFYLDPTHFIPFPEPPSDEPS